MPNLLCNSGIKNNHRRGNVADFLKARSLYGNLLDAAIESIAQTFQRRVATGLQTGRGFVIPNQQDQAREATDFELITWLVIKAP